MSENINFWKRANLWKRWRITFSVYRGSSAEYSRFRRALWQWCRLYAKNWKGKLRFKHIVVVKTYANTEFTLHYFRHATRRQILRELKANWRQIVQSITQCDLSRMLFLITIPVLCKNSVSCVALRYFLIIYCVFGCETFADQSEVSPILPIKKSCNVNPPVADPSCNVIWQLWKLCSLGCPILMIYLPAEIQHTCLYSSSAPEDLD